MPRRSPDVRNGGPDRLGGGQRRRDREQQNDDAEHRALAGRGKLPPHRAERPRPPWSDSPTGPSRSPVPSAAQNRANGEMRAMVAFCGTDLVSCLAVSGSGSDAVPHRVADGYDPVVEVPLLEQLQVET